MAGLPDYATADELLRAVHTELVGLRADLKASCVGEPAPDGQVELREPTVPGSTTARTRKRT